MKNNNSSEDLKREMERLGAREFEVVALSMDADRGLAALAVAQAKGVDHPIAYATKLFDSPDWQPSGASRRVATNVHVEKACGVCDGDRFVSVTDDWKVLYGETWAPCAQCNADANTAFWRIDGHKFVSAPR